MEATMSVPSAWSAFVTATSSSTGSVMDEAAVRSAMKALAQSSGMLRAAERYVTLRCCREVEEVHLPRLASALRGAENGDGLAGGGTCASAALERGLMELGSVLDGQAAWIRCLGHAGFEKRKQSYEEEITAILTRHLPRELPMLLLEHYRRMIRDYIAQHDGDDEMEEVDEDVGGSNSAATAMETDAAAGTDLLRGGSLVWRRSRLEINDGNIECEDADTCRISQSMRRIGLGRVAEEACSSSLYKALDEYVFEAAKAAFEEPALPAARRWLRRGPFRLLSRVLPRANVQSLKQWRSRLHFHLLESLGDLRTDQMFNITVEYPESKPAIDDLRVCIEGTGQSKKLVASFSRAIRNRLLHPGAPTPTILRMYVDVIRVMKDLDSSGVLLEAVGAPIQEYLRKRSDAIRCIVTMLTEGSDTGSLLEDVGEDSAGSKESAGDVDVETAEAFEAAMRWEPESLEAAAPGSLESRGGDVVSMLVGVYGSKELFVNEYRALLAEKVLSRGSEYDSSNEIHAMELLKLRFGEQSLHNCDVMLRDLAESKRINSNVQQELSQNDRKLSATIMSYLFWPQLTSGEKLNLPPRIDELFDRFASKYHQLKTPRKLEWRKHLGLVDLDLEFEDGRELSFSVAPPLAAVIMYFEDRSVWPMDELATTLGITLALLRRRAAYWIGHGVLVEEHRDGTTSLRAVETASEATTAKEGGGPMAFEDGADGSGAVADTSDQDAAKYESYIIGMLTNFSSLGADRIHNMLKMFMPEYDRSERQLTGILKRMVASEKLVEEDGLFKKSAASG